MEGKRIEAVQRFTQSIKLRGRRGRGGKSSSCRWWWGPARGRRAGQGSAAQLQSPESSGESVVAVPTSWPRKLPSQSSPLPDHHPPPSASFSSREGLTFPSILSTTPSAALDPAPGTPAALWGTRAHKAAEVGGRASQHQAPSASLPAARTVGDAAHSDCSPALRGLPCTF